MGNHAADVDAVWAAASALLRERLSDGAWKMWFSGVRAVEVHDGTIILAVPSRMARDHLAASYSETIRDVLRAATAHDHVLEFVIQREPGDDLAPEPLLPEPPPEPAPSAPGTDRFVPDENTLNPRYTFDAFVIGASNRFAHAAALSVAEQPASSYNPLFIYGRAGLGKTHLLHGIGHYLREVYTKLRVRYVSTESFMNEFVEAIRTNTMNSFKPRYREVDVLLVDDIQFLEERERLQEEFFHTFNSLHNASKQVVITSDRAPKSIATLEDRLRSRFEWGLITDIQPPEFETRLAILRKKADAEQFDHVPDEVLAFIATHIKDNVRELEGALIRVAAYGSLHGDALSEEVARHVLSDLLPTSEPRVITAGLILDETAKLFGFTVDDLVGKSRRRPLVRARQISMYVSRELTDFSYPQIAREFGGRDHTTVMHAVERITGLLGEQPAVLDRVSELINRIKHGDPT